MDTNKFTIPLAIIIAGFIIGGSIYLSGKQPRQIDNNPNNTTSKLEEIRPVSSDDRIMGNPNADIFIVEYSDIECPFCKMFHNTLNQIMVEYGPSGRVAWVYRHFPIDGLHKNARTEAEATECAYEMGGNTKFWEYTNILYDRTPSNDGLALTELPKIAQEIGLDVQSFNECLNSRRHSDRVEADYQNAVLTGGEGTPHSIIVTKTGKKYQIIGAQSFAFMKQEIDRILSEM